MDGITPYNELDALGRKARDAEQYINCRKCPIGTTHKDDNFICTEVCDYVFLQGFRKGYKKRKQEKKDKQATQTTK